MIKVYGHPGSTCTRKVLTTLLETSTPYEFELVELSKGEHKQEPHLSRQPFGQVPTIEDAGFSLFEARAICRYLSERSGNWLTPSDSKQRATMEQWISVEQSNFSPNAMRFVFQFVFARPQEPGAIEAATTMIEKVFAVLSKPLEKNTFIVGDQFTLADIGFMPYIEYLMTTPAKLSVEKYPNVLAWWNRVSARPTWRKVAGHA
jgi:glutathione S-transferase